MLKHKITRTLATLLAAIVLGGAGMLLAPEKDAHACAAPPWLPDMCHPYLIANIYCWGYGIGPDGTCVPAPPNGHHGAGLG